MSDFVTGLRAELVAAAEREERRRLPLLPPLRPLLPALAVAALAAIAIVVVVARQGDHRQVAKPHGQPKELFGGTLEPGVRYRPRGFDPPLVLSVTDRRWNAELVEPGGILISRQPVGGSPAPAIGFLGITRGGFPVYDPDVRNARRSLRRAPKDYIGWLRAHPDIEAQAPRPTTLAGHPAQVMDFRFRFDHPAHPALQCNGLPYECSALGPGEDAHRNGERDRIWKVRTADATVYVLLAGFDTKAYADIARAAKPVLDKLKIDD